MPDWKASRAGSAKEYREMQKARAARESTRRQPRKAKLGSGAYRSQLRKLAGSLKEQKFQAGVRAVENVERQGPIGSYKIPAADRQGLGPSYRFPPASRGSIDNLTTTARGRKGPEIPKSELKHYDKAKTVLRSTIKARDKGIKITSSQMAGRLGKKVARKIPFIGAAITGYDIYKRGKNAKK